MRFLKSQGIVLILAAVAVLLVGKNLLWPWLKPKFASRPAAPTAATVSAPVPTAASSGVPKPTPSPTLNTTVTKLVDVMKAAAAAPAAGARRERLNPRELSNLAVAWNSSPLRDPFKKRSMLSEKSARDQLTLTGILRQTDSELAVINNRILAIGDSILDFKIEKVEADRVWVSGPNGREALDFKISVQDPKRPGAVASEPITPPATQSRPSSRNRLEKPNAGGDGESPAELPDEKGSDHLIDSVALATFKYGSLWSVSSVDAVNGRHWFPDSNMAAFEAADLFHSHNFVNMEDSEVLLLHY